MAFWWKFLLNPDILARQQFSGGNRHHRMQVQLTWRWNNMEYVRHSLIQFNSIQ